MLKKLVLLLALLAVSVSTVFAAAVDVNSADQATLETLKGIGAVKSKAIVDERAKNGPFKDANDLARRVHGLGVKSVTKLEGEGLTVGGSSAAPTHAGGKRETGEPATANTAQPPAKTAAAATEPSPAAATSASRTHESKSQTKNKSKSKKGKKNKATATSAASDT